MELTFFTRGAKSLEIDSLQEQGIGMGDLNKLKNAGICTIMGVLMTYVLLT